MTHDPVSVNQERVSLCHSGTRFCDSERLLYVFVAQEPAPGTQERVSCDSGARFCHSRAGLSDSKSLSVPQERVSLTQELVPVTQERASVTQGFVLAFQARFSSNSRAQRRLNSKVEQAATRADSIHLARRGPSFLQLMIWAIWFTIHARADCIPPVPVDPIHSPRRASPAACPGGCCPG